MSKSRITATNIFVIGAFILLVCRYGYLQLANYSQFLQQSINNYSSTVSTLPTRGTFIDRNGLSLTNNIISYAIGILPKDYKNSEDIFSTLEKYVTLSALDKKKFNNLLHNSKNYDLVIIKDDLSDKEVATLTAHNYEFPEVSIFARTKRYYPFDELYSHSIGYVSRISNSDLGKIGKNGNNLNYLRNDYVGKNGLEEYYESTLRGTIGKKIIQTDATGNEIGLISNTHAIDGATISLTLDNGLQKLANQLLGTNQGAIVAIDPQNGGILAFVSKPGYNPNWFIDGINTDDWSDLRDDPRKPLLNRASQSSFPPGSTFKPFMGLTALYLGYIKPYTEIYDPGYFSIPGSTHRFRDLLKLSGFGNINMARAIAVSSDTYFFRLAYELGIDNIDKGISLFGLGKKTGIDIPNENSGLLPSKEWKERRFAKDKYQKNWLPADSVTVGIGQGFNHYTPLQMAYATSIIANDGIAIKPHFLNKILNKDGSIKANYTIESHTLPIPKSDFEFMKKAMQMVITQGTGKGIGYGLKYTLAGKSGTAQVVSSVKGGRQQKFAGKRYKDHAWFIAFAPVDKPKIVIAVFVENGGFGSAASAPIVRKMMDYYILGANVTESASFKKNITTPDASETSNDADNSSIEEPSDDTEN